MVQIKPQLMKSKSSTESAFFSSDSSIANKSKYWLTTDTKYIKLTRQDLYPTEARIHISTNLWHSPCLCHLPFMKGHWKIQVCNCTFLILIFFLEFLKKHFFDLHEALICFNKAYFKFLGVQILLTFQFFFHLNWRRGGCQVYFKQHLKVSIW